MHPLCSTVWRMSQPATSLRDRKRRAVQDDLTLAAVDLFISNGFDETPVERIAAAVGMSERTFFRYFASKDDVLEQLSARWRERTAELLAARPTDEPAWTSMRRSLDAFVEAATPDAFTLPLLRLIYSTPKLYGRHMLNMRRWREMFADGLRARTPGTSELTLKLRATMAVACFEAARETWTESEGERPLAELLDAAMAEVWPLQPAPAG